MPLWKQKVTAQFSLSQEQILMLVPESHGLRRDCCLGDAILKTFHSFYVAELQLKLIILILFSTDKNKYLPGK